MNAKTVFLLCCPFAIPLAAQNDVPSVPSSLCHPPTPHLFGAPGVLAGTEAEREPPAETESAPPTARPATDEQLYSRYFRYVAAWEACLDNGVPEETLLDKYPDPYPAALNEKQLEVVSLVANDWEQSRNEPAHRFDSGEMSSPPTPLRTAEPDTWGASLEMKARRQRFEQAREERAAIIESRLESLRLALGKNSFREFDDYVHTLYHASPGRLVHQPLTESAMFARYLSYIAAMDKFAGNAGEDGQAAAKARADEQGTCELSDKDESVLRQEADSFHADLEAHMPRRTTAAGGSFAAPIRPREREQIVDTHVERLRSGLTKPAFEKVEKRVHVLYESDGPIRVVAASGAEAK